VKVDNQTLRDLEVLPDASTSATLVDRLDRTVTRGGRSVLARRLRSPLTSPEEIHEVQAALRFLCDEHRRALPLPEEHEIAAVVRYVDSNLGTLRSLRGPRSWWEAVSVRVRYPQHYEAAMKGGGLVRSFMARMERIQKSLEEGPTLLSRFAVQIEESTSTPALKEGILSVREGWVGHGILRSDRLLRGEAREEIRKLVVLVHELDALLSMARAGTELGFSLPEFTSGSQVFRFDGLWHPFLDDPVANDLVLETEERVIFLTGPNMAGKTTYLKACGVAVLLAHCGMGVPARKASIPPLARLITAVRTEDNLWEGVSYFQAEARRVRSILDEVAGGGPCLVIVDELFRGTNVKDAFDATTAVLRGFAKIRDSRFLVASHLTEVAEELKDLRSVLLRHFEASSVNGKVAFSYRVAPGLSSQRLGMEVLRREGVLEALEALDPADETDRPR
jgi:DNA mismatch repair protein MutS